MAVPPAILNYIDHGAYPEAEDVASASLDSDAIASLLSQLRQAQDDVKQEIRRLSKSTAPDIDTWIDRAKSLQGDILRSRDTARQIVAEHETTKRLRATADEARQTAALRDKEVRFQETLGGVLEHVGYANGILDQAQDEAVHGNVAESLDLLETAEESIGGLDGLRHTEAVGVLENRLRQLKESLIETGIEFWNRLVLINAEENTITVSKEGFTAKVDSIGLEAIVPATQRLGVFDDLVKKLSKDVDRYIIRPRLTVDDEWQVARVDIEDGNLSCGHRTDDGGIDHLLSDLINISDFLANRLPASISVPLSATLVPALTLRLEEQWLEPTIPLEIKDMRIFQQTLSGVQQLADHIDRLGWDGVGQLRDWVVNAPKSWLTKRRETALGDVRNLVFSGLRETKTVERVETHILSRDDHAALQGGSQEVGGDGAEDDWDAWDDGEDESKVTKTATAPQPSSAADEDDGSAWDNEDVGSGGGEKPASEGRAAGEDEGEAWGWGDEEAASQHPPSTVADKKPAPTPSVDGDPQPQERQMTLRETFTVTAIPDGILSIIQHVISDAQTLAGPNYSSSPIAPAATGLYSLPTLALAIYRATAPTAYTKLATGNMLIYNDASHLASQLRAWQASQPPSSRLRLDADVKALETFAKRAYSTEMESQRTVLRDLLDGAQGFASVTRPPFKQAAESAVEEVVARLRDVHGQWKRILSDGALLQSLGSLLATVTGKIITEIEDLGDIGEEDSHQLHHLVTTITESKSMFTNPEGHDMTFIYCPNWLKFQYLGEILESSLVDIKYLWNEGELALEFEAEEVVELIEGLFADTEVRRRAIGEIRRGGRR